MFKSSVTQTPFTTDAANAYFANITGDSFGYDRSFLATLRALLAPRMQEGESISTTKVVRNHEHHKLSPAERRGFLMPAWPQPPRGVGG